MLRQSRRTYGNKHCFYVLIACLFLIVVTYFAPLCLPSYATNASNYLFLLLSFIPRLLIIVWLWLDYLFVAKKTTKPFMILILLVALLSISYLFNLSGLEYSLNLVFVYTCFVYFSRFKLGKRYGKIILFVASVLALVILLNTSTSASFKIHGRIPGKLNPNTGAFALAMVFFAHITYFYNYKKSVYLLTAISCFALQFIYESRTVMMGMILYVVLLLFFKAGRKTFNKKTVITLLLLSSIMGLAVAYIYTEVLFVNYGYGNIIIYGKDLFSGREKIWSLAWDSVKNNLLFGVGNRLNYDHLLAQGVDAISENVLMTNAHNQPLGIIAAFGIMVFAVFYYGISFAVSMQYENKKMPRTIGLYMLTVIVMSYTDITFFSDYNFIFIVLIYGLISGMKAGYSKEIKPRRRYVGNRVYAHL